MKKSGFSRPCFTCRKVCEKPADSDCCWFRIKAVYDAVFSQPPNNRILVVDKGTEPMSHTYWGSFMARVLHLSVD
jgi:hypothetical protein